MNNIKVLKKGIDVSKIKAQLDENPGDWGSQKGLDTAEIKDPHAVSYTHLTLPTNREV